MNHLTNHLMKLNIISIRSIDESKNQIPHFNTIVNNYQEQSLQTAKEITENYIESQKSVINSAPLSIRDHTMKALRIS